MTGGTRTTCPYCGVGCGVIATPRPDGSVAIEGDPDHPANFGRLCSKGSALGETLDLDGRVLAPVIAGKRSDWDTALDLVAGRFAETVAEHGPDAVAFYVSGQLLTEDYYVANKLMKGFIGSGNIDTNSRLCMASSVAGHRRAFGSDTVPGVYEDLEQADLVVLVGSNLLWCHPVLYQRIAAAKEARPAMRIVLIDPRRTKTADLADLHLALEPDSDAALFNGLLKWLGDTGATEDGWVARHTNGFASAADEASNWPVDAVSAATGLNHDDIEHFYRLWSGCEKTVTAYSQGVNQSCAGTDKVNAIINCHLATARIGRPGMGPFSLTGQPNAMGGRETGGLANMLAAHMELGDPVDRARVRRFWNAPNLAREPGLKAVDLFRAVEDGRIKALWIMATNPAVSMPDATAVEAAIAKCPFVVISDVMAQTDTVRHADVLLPSLGWGEKDGTVTNSERRISRQRAFLAAPGEARPDWWQMAEVGKRMGWDEEFNWADNAAVFAEYAALTAFENGGTRDLDLSAATGLDRTAYDGLPPFQWPQRDSFDADRQTRFFSQGGFFTPDRKARFVAVKPPARAAVGDVLRLNTGRIRDQWHTMTRTAKSARLNAHLSEPYCELHPDDAARRGIAEAALVRVRSDLGDTIVRALITRDQKPGNVFVPMHWTDQFASAARVDRLIPSVTDPHSGQPALKGAYVEVEAADMACHGFAVLREKPETVGLDYWALAKTDLGWRLEFALADTPSDMPAYLLNLIAADAEHLAAIDSHRDLARAARFRDGKLQAATFLSREPVEVSRTWAVELLDASFPSPQDRWRVLAGRPAADAPDKGAIVCSCMSVGVNQITDAARSGCLTVASIGETTLAGTNCGSCKAEISEILHAHRLIAAE